MISSYNKISWREVFNELFELLGQVLEHRVEAPLIGGSKAYVNEIAWKA